MTPRPLSDFWVASCTPDGGAYRFRLYEDETVVLLDSIPMPAPMFLALQGELLWAILRAPFSDSKDSGVIAYDIKSKRQAVPLRSTMGEVACHIAVDGDTAYCANYVSGSVFATPCCQRIHEGAGIDPVRQTSPHVHCTMLSPDKKYLLCCDLGLDRILVYDRDLQCISSASVPQGAGARHLAFSNDGAFVYCINEMAASVSVFAYADGHLTYLHNTSAKPAEIYNKQGSGAAIKLSRDGKRLYVTERASETIALFAVEGAKLTLQAHTSSHGAEPRDFTLLANDTYAVCTNQFGNCLTFYRVLENGKLEHFYTLPLAAPLCAVECETSAE